MSWVIDYIEGKLKNVVYRTFLFFYLKYQFNNTFRSSSFIKTLQYEELLNTLNDLV